MKITLTDNQAQIINDALDLYSRILIGQYEEAVHVGMMYNVAMREDVEPEDFHTFKDNVCRLKEVFLGIPNNGSMGIYNHKVHDNARIAWDMQKVIRHHLAWKRHPEGSKFGQIMFDKPDQSCIMKLIEIKEE